VIALQIEVSEDASISRRNTLLQDSDAVERWKPGDKRSAKRGDRLSQE